MSLGAFFEGFAEARARKQQMEREREDRQRQLQLSIFKHVLDDPNTDRAMRATALEKAGELLGEKKGRGGGVLGVFGKLFGLGDDGGARPGTNPLAPLVAQMREQNARPAHEVEPGLPSDVELPLTRSHYSDFVGKVGPVGGLPVRPTEQLNARPPGDYSPRYGQMTGRQIEDARHLYRFGQEQRIRAGVDEENDARTLDRAKELKRMDIEARVADGERRLKEWMEKHQIKEGDLVMRERKKLADSIYSRSDWTGTYAEALVRAGEMISSNYQAGIDRKESETDESRANIELIKRRGVKLDFDMGVKLVELGAGIPAAAKRSFEIDTKPLFAERAAKMAEIKSVNDQLARNTVYPSEAAQRLDAAEKRIKELDALIEEARKRYNAAPNTSRLEDIRRRSRGGTGGPPSRPPTPATPSNVRGVIDRVRNRRAPRR